MEYRKKEAEMNLKMAPTTRERSTDATIEGDRYRNPYRNPHGPSDPTIYES